MTNSSQHSPRSLRLRFANSALSFFFVPPLLYFARKSQREFSSGNESLASSYSLIYNVSRTQSKEIA
jgi:hypothetical protein